MIVILAVCASHHRKPYNENQVGGTFWGADPWGAKHFYLSGLSHQQFGSCEICNKLSDSCKKINHEKLLSKLFKKENRYKMNCSERFHPSNLYSNTWQMSCTRWRTVTMTIPRWRWWRRSRRCRRRRWCWTESSTTAGSSLWTTCWRRTCLTRRTLTCRDDRAQRRRRRQRQGSALTQKTKKRIHTSCSMPAPLPYLILLTLGFCSRRRLPH